MKTEYTFDSSELESSLKECGKKGITELVVHDPEIAGNKSRLLHFLKAVEKDAPELFVSIKVNPALIDSEVCSQASRVNCSLEIPASSDVKKNRDGAELLVFDKKFYAKKCSLLNNAGLVFGMELFYADNSRDTLKSFKERVDFICAQYPNHIDFPQTENAEENSSAKVTGVFSGNDIRYARDIAFACRTFYSAGRAVAWFNSVLKPLRLPASQFFADFAEWQRVNNCDYRSGFVPENEPHSEIEKMQLLFLSMKYEEKKASDVFPVVKDIVLLNGALSRVVAEGIESVIETQYHPDDLLGPESFDLEAFSNDVCMEHSSVRVFLNDGDVDYKVL